MNNPFENQDGLFRVLLNEEGQYSLWPSFAPNPEGWSQVYGDGNRQACVDYIESHWTDMRPGSLRRAPVAVEAT